MVSILKRYMLHIVFCVSAMVLLSSATFFSIYAVNNESKIINEIEQIPDNPKQGNNEVDNSGGNGFVQTPAKLKKYETGLLLGVDKSGSLTDVIMLFYLDVDARKVKVISIPRDIKIDFRKKEFRKIKQNNPNNNVLYCKLNEVYGYCGQGEQGLKDLQSVVSVITGIDINYYATVNLDLLVEVVDTVGGVWFDVPQNMRYDDKYQDLYINLKKGYQLLDGEKAEQLVRYRRYEWGDLQRIEVQRNFISALAREVLENSSLRELSNVVTLAYDGMETDIPLSVVLNYATYFYNNRHLNLFTSMYMMTIPSFPEESNDGPYFQAYDSEEVLDSVKRLIDK
ncbi:MAG: uncharacterized protein K0R15_2304 [Clostridiales bacterium]|jgi:LCP family protein required for cell wall assembly|nr:uncharacterized protein [Clostridiales bacterium]